MPDVLDNTVTFLAKRDGIDKTLKVIRYTSKLLLATSLPAQSPNLGATLKAVEGSIGTTRKGLKLGKFLGVLKSLRSLSPTDPHAGLELVAGLGDMSYLFLEQFQWLIKMGVMSKRHADTLSYVSAWCELVCYAASITLCLVRQRESLEQELELLAELQQHRQASQRGGLDEKWGKEGEASYQAKLEKLHAARALRTLGLLQDVADAVLALADIRSSGKLLHSPVLLAVAGLVSGALSGYTKWPGVKP